MMLFNRFGNNNFMIRGLNCKSYLANIFIKVTNNNTKARLNELKSSFIERFGVEIVSSEINKNALLIETQAVLELHK